jgi:Secretion system C-terminal sorting domain
MKRLLTIGMLAFACQLSAQETMEETTLGKVDSLNQWDLRCFPNPTSDLLIIKSSKEIKSIDFFDINGRELKPTGMPNECYSLSDLPSGWVFLLVESADGFIEKKNVYKQ